MPCCRLSWLLFSREKPTAVVEQEAARFPLLELPDGVLSHLMLVADPEAAMGLGSACIRLNRILRECRLEVLMRMLDVRRKANIEEMTGQLCAQEPGLQLRGFTLRAHTLRTGPTTAADGVTAQEVELGTVMSWTTPSLLLNIAACEGAVLGRVLRQLLPLRGRRSMPMLWKVGFDRLHSFMRWPAEYCLWLVDVHLYEADTAPGAKPPPGWASLAQALAMHFKCMAASAHRCPGFIVRVRANPKQYVEFREEGSSSAWTKAGVSAGLPEGQRIVVQYV